eukprot:TRINITY_DN3433_c0_g1_i1.p1 TRINITY_DN3433_c0_g1~~TRINITY_DN3433_c0_g1_i1.p1  ORF type:complete len:199 (+),score=82.25 TRINITY_DN3433_c0_g1_i1:110-706(+)
MGSEGKEKKKRKHVEEEERNEEEEEKLKKKKRKKSLGGEAGEEKGEDGDGEEETGRSKWDNVSIIAKPLAGKKLNKKCLKLVKRAGELKLLKRGVKEVVKSIRKGQSGLCFIAGNISPVDVISHLPILCEESNVPYIYVPSKEELGAASGTKRPASCLLVQLSNPKADAGDGGSEGKKLKSEYAEIKAELEGMEVVFQ